MNAELYGSSLPSETNNSGPAPLPDLPGHPARAEMENSVLDALRPLLRPKRKKQRDELEALRLSADVPASSPSSADEDDPVGPEVLDASASALKADPEDDDYETFAAIGQDLERRSRQSATMARLLQQHRQQLQTAEKDRDDAYEKLARVVPVVNDTAQALREAMNARKLDEDPARMHKLFMLNGRALDELEKVASTLFADFLWVKSAWEQYAKSVEDARKLRASLDA